MKSLLAGVIVLLVGPPAAGVAKHDVVHFSMEIPTTIGGVPACAPLSVVAAKDGRPTAVKALKGPWPRTKLERSPSEDAERFEEFAECVASTPLYADRYDEQGLAMFGVGILSEGMPVEFAHIALGPPHPVSAKDRSHHWGKQSDAKDPPEVRSVSGKRAPIARLGRTIRSRVSIDADRRIDGISADQLELESWPAVYCDPATVAGLTLPECRVPAEAGPEANRSEQRVDPRAGFEAGMSAYRGGAYAEALAAWLPLAEAGNAHAQYSVADMYLQGEGVERDPVEALRWLREAAEQEFSQAQYHLGFLYAGGQDVGRDPVEAYYWMSRAARLGNADAQASREILSSSMSPQERSRAEQRLDETGFERPRLVFRVEPVFPEVGRVARLEGAVVLQAVIDSSGKVGQAEVLRSTRPNLGFEDAAIEAVQQWHFEPALRKGVPLAVYFVVLVEFTLH